jgi:magnesium-transporting ATPase (P-type)
MKAFRQIKPDDSEVLRNGKWIRYDATSLVKGDIIRVEEGDIVPADCVVLKLESDMELLVDHRSVTGEDKPRSANFVVTGNGSEIAATATIQPTQLFWGGRVVQGAAIAVATSVGSSTLVASLIREGRFPPLENVLLRGATGGAGNVALSSTTNTDADEEVGIALIARDTL